MVASPAGRRRTLAGGQETDPRRSGNAKHHELLMPREGSQQRLLPCPVRSLVSFYLLSAYERRLQGQGARCWRPHGLTQASTEDYGTG
jgi:hypothetical protein